MPLTLRPAYRAVLRRQLITELTGIGDVYLAVEADQWGTALALRRRFEDCMRLLDDLGWREDDPAEGFAITMDPIALMRVLARLHERAGETLEQHVAETLVERDTIRDATLTLAICGEVLVGLASDGVHDAVVAYREARAAEEGSERS